MRGEGGLPRFSVKTFLSLLVPKSFVGEPVIVTQNLRDRKILGKRGGGITSLRQKHFCLIVPTNFVGETFSLSLFLGIDKFYASEGCVTIFCRKFVVLRCGNFS